MTIAKPECKLGYPYAQLETVLGPRLPEFNGWMFGQTMSICDGRDCGPHGAVAYAWDVDRFLAGAPITD